MEIGTFIQSDFYDDHCLILKYSKDGKMVRVLEFHTFDNRTVALVTVNSLGRRELGKHYKNL